MSSGYANVQALEAIPEFRNGLIRITDNVAQALENAETELKRTMLWLERDQVPHWKSQISKASEAVQRAKAALRQREMQNATALTRKDPIDEQKALYKAQRHLEEVYEKAKATKKWMKKLEKEGAAFRADLRRLKSLIRGDMPIAYAQLERFHRHLQAYLAETAPDRDVRFSAAISSSVTDVKKTTEERLEEQAEQTDENPEA